jgi:hypothetical protein
MKSVLIIIAVVICWETKADLTVNGNGSQEFSGAQSVATGESFDSCVAKWAQKHQGQRQLNISLQPNDPNLIFMKDCTGGSKTFLSSDPQLNKAIAGRLVAAWAKVRTADGAQTIRRIEITESSPGSAPVPVYRIEKGTVTVEPGGTGDLFGAGGTQYTFTRKVLAN